MHKRIPILLAMLLVTIGCSSPFAAKIIPTATIAFTATPTVSPTPTLTPTPLPTPTPQPAVRIELAEQAIFTGDFETARREFQAAQTNNSDPEIQAAAALGIGRSVYLMQNYSTAIEQLKIMIDTYPDSSLRADAYYFLAKSYEATQIWDQAAESYTKFIELKPGKVDAYIQERRGDAYLNAGNPAGAATAYEAAIQAPQETSTIWVELKLGQAYAASGDFNNAINRYIEIYEKSDNDYARAQANYLLGKTYLTMGMPEQAYARFLDSVASFPKAYDTYSGLVVLVSSGIEVDDLNRGIVDYYATEYGLAIDALNRYIDNGGENPVKAYYYRALSQLALNEAEKALQDWDTIINSYPNDNLWSTAVEEKAYILWAYLDRHDEAANVLLEYVSQYPESAFAPDFLFQAARILERDNRFVEAGAAWERLMDEYPSAENSFRSIFLAGITYYRAGDLQKALTVFQRASILATTTEEQSAAYLWTGKVQEKLGDSNSARQAWETAAQFDPTGYYSERANQLLQNKVPFTIDQSVDLGYDLNQERLEAEDWLKSTFGIAPEVDLSGLEKLAADPRIERGTTFWRLGLYDEARNEFESVRKSILADPVQTYRLMNLLLDLGVYRSAILSSRQILDLAHLDDIGTLKAPVYFNHIRFGVYFKDLVLEVSQAESMHPLFLFSVMRQESLFEGFADSSAGARGLMQIMPETGKEIQSNIGWPQDYSADDLYRPEVSIPFGARYLARQRDYFNQDLFATLAAYNGGPGNTIIWYELSQKDPDLLLEVIRADETRTYIMNIYEYFYIYRLLYERGL